MNTTHPLSYRARPNQATQQSVLPGRYRGWVMALAMAGFTIAFLGWLNESWLYLFENPIWLNRYTEYAIILAFGVWRIRAEQNSYTRKRLIILVTVVTLFWWFIPWLTPVFEPYVGYVWSQPVFPALHTPGTITFFLTLLLVLLFGRRIICGFGCPCVAVRETVGFPFRRFTLRGDWAWRLRHTKWFFFIWYLGGIGRHPIPAQHLDHNPGRTFRPGGGDHLFWFVFHHPHYRQPLLLPLPLPLRLDIRPTQSCRLLQHKNGHPTMHRLPALRTGMRHGHPGMEARQDER
ncbi:MAG: hypothetical protein AB2565_14060 [Candidatus Thiodiazotropha endolucinida]|uniref:Uncharacterized protein n=1 Tax=Candidatus Thiodiazotropha endolucinida TaxID=1655433 RepID=A0A7Z1AH44_9GAMM|nr:hypothetical protein [Candidatus Thiodiazotropha endolucinida]ODJ89622.1 hypothetical protein CODIS_01820 [Candidatus Thiodiazotropha endolucinida]